MNGKGKQTCIRCDKKSVAGLSKGNGLCPYHLAESLWGKEWANQCYPKSESLNASAD